MTRFDPERDAEVRKLRREIESLKAQLERESANAGVSRATNVQVRYRLRPAEARVLCALSIGGLVPLDRLLDAAVVDDAGPRLLTVYICGIRKKLKAAGSRIVIENIPHVGYQIIGGLDELRAAMKPPVELLNTIDDERLR